MPLKIKLHWTTRLLIVLIVGIVFFTINEKWVHKKETFEEDIVTQVNKRVGSTDAVYISQVSENAHKVVVSEKVYHVYVSRNHSEIRLKFIENVMKNLE